MGLSPDQIKECLEEEFWRLEEEANSTQELILEERERRLEDAPQEFHFRDIDYL